MNVYTILMMAIFLTPLFTAAEDAITVEGDGLELVREYRIEGDRVELIYENTVLGNEINLRGDLGLMPLVLEVESSGVKKVIYLNRSLEVKYVSSDIEGITEVYPLIGAKFLVNTGFGGNCSDTFYQGKKLYSLEDDNTTEIGEEGFVNVLNSKENVIFYQAWDHIAGTVRSIKNYNIDGNIKTIYEKAEDDPALFGGYIETFEEDKDWFFISCPFIINTDFYPNERLATKVYDTFGNYIFSLREGSFVKTLPSFNRNVYYGSDSYICQICTRGEVIREEGSLSISFRGKKYLEVYDGIGNEIWSYETEDGMSRPEIFVSDSEEYIALISAPLGMINVFSLPTGEKRYDIADAFEVNDKYLSDGYISPDGTDIIANLYEHENGNTNYRLYIFNNGSRSSILYSSKKVCDFSVYGNRYLVFGIGEYLHIYKLK